MKGFVAGVLAVLAALWLLGVVNISCRGGASGEVTPSSEPAAAPRLAEKSREPAVDDLVSFRGEGFSISLPGTPVRQAKSDIGNDYVFYNVIRGEGLFMGIGFTTIPREKRRPDLHAELERSAALQGARVRDESASLYKGLPARQARLTGIGGRTEFIRVIDAGSRFFQLEYTVRGSDRAIPAVFKRFASSLHLR